MTESMMERLDGVRLGYGVHTDPSKGMCAMEAVAWLAGEPHTDAPRCVTTPLRKLVIEYNDGVGPEERQALKPLLPSLIGTATDGLSEQRAYMLTNFAVDKTVRHFYGTRVQGLLGEQVSREFEEVFALLPLEGDAEVSLPTLYSLLDRASKHCIGLGPSHFAQALDHLSVAVSFADEAEPGNTEDTRWHRCAMVTAQVVASYGGATHADLLELIERLIDPRKV